jgi:hypothetical protein
MGCWHGCGPWHGWPPPRGWYGPPTDESEWLEEERLLRRPRPRRGVSEPSAASLEARLDELRDELERVEAALAGLGRPTGETPEQR